MVNFDPTAILYFVIYSLRNLFTLVLGIGTEEQLSTIVFLTDFALLSFFATLFQIPLENLNFQFVLERRAQDKTKRFFLSYVKL